MAKPLFFLEKERPEALFFNRKKGFAESMKRTAE
jgi:hypothetical protein